MKTLNIDFLNEKIKNLSADLDIKVLEKVKNFILTASDFELANINTNKFSDKEKLDKISVLKTFLHLTKSGVFNLLWAVHCPSCKGMNQISTTLININRVNIFKQR